MAEIKEAYRLLPWKYHPDRCSEGEKSGEVTRRLNRAYRLLLAYCEALLADMPMNRNGLSYCGSFNPPRAKASWMWDAVRVIICSGSLAWVCGLTG